MAFVDQLKLGHYRDLTTVWPAGDSFFAGIRYTARKLGVRAMSLSRSREVNGMTRKFLTRPKVADGERHDRFVAMTQQIGASDNVKNFERAFQKAFQERCENVVCLRRLAAHRTKGAGARRRAEGN